MDYYNPEADFQNFSGGNAVFNQKLNANRGLYKATDKKSRATIQIAVKNFTNSEQVYELFNSNNSISIQPDDALYAGRVPTSPGFSEAWKPLDSAGIVDLISVPEATPLMAESIASWGRKGSLLYARAWVGGVNQPISDLVFNLREEAEDILGVKISLRSTLGGNTYKRLIEKMRTSVIHVTDWKIQCSNEDQFQLSIAQKDFTITGASADDEYQISSSVSSKDNNTKIVEIGDKTLLIDGDTRLSGIILPLTTMVFTFEIDIINEVTKRVF